MTASTNSGYGFLRRLKLFLRVSAEAVVAQMIAIAVIDFTVYFARPRKFLEADPEWLYLAWSFARDILGSTVLLSPFICLFAGVFAWREVTSFRRGMRAGLILGVGISLLWIAFFLILLLRGGLSSPHSSGGGASDVLLILLIPTVMIMLYVVLVAEFVVWRTRRRIAAAQEKPVPA